MTDANKAEQMMQTALSNSWKAEIIPDTEGFAETGNPRDFIWRLYAIRGEEKLQVDFEGFDADRLVWALYTYGAHKVKPHRTAGVLRLITGKPDPTKFKTGTDSVEKLVQARSVPWDRDAPFLDILLAVLGRQIKWVRKMDGEVLSAYIPRESNEKSKHFRVKESPTGSGNRVLEWTNTEGFHAVGIDQIIDVD